MLEWSKMVINDKKRMKKIIMNEANWQRTNEIMNERAEDSAKE